MKSQQMMYAAVLHGLGETPRYEPFPAPLAGDGGAVVTVTAAVTDPGMAAWKTLLWEGELALGQTVLVLGATGTSSRIATQLATRRGARVVAAGRNQRVLVQLLARGADAVIRVDRPREELAAAIAAEGPYDLIVDYLWVAPAEAVFAALTRADPTPPSGSATSRSASGPARWPPSPP
jgi:NADPH:quinone reductase-like Zn-dependent oxidoreductase